MSTQAQIPMIAPDGTPGMADAASAQEMASQGYRPGLRLRAPDGKTGIGSFQDLKSLLSSGYKTEGDYQQAQKNVPSSIPSTIDQMRSNVQSNMQDSPQTGGTFHDAIAAPLGHIASRIAGNLVSPLLDVAHNATISPEQRLAEGMDAAKDSAVGRLISPTAPTAGHSVSGDAAEMVGNAIPLLPGAGTQARGYANSTNPLGDMAGDASTALLLAGMGKAIAPTPNVRGQNYTPNHAAAFEGLTSQATGMGKNFIPQNITPEALSPIRQTVANMQEGSPVEQAVAGKVTGGSTAPLDRVAAFQNVLQKSMDNLEAQHAPVLAQAAGLPADTSSLVRSLKAKITPTMDTSDVSAINALIDRTGKVKTIGDLGRFRQELNTESSPQYRQSAMQAGRSGLSVQALGDHANDTRAAYYDQLQQATGKDMAPIKRQESNLMTVQEAIQNQQSPLAVAEGKFAAPTTLRESAGNVANIIKDPKSTVTQTILRESPATRTSMLIRQALKGLPDANPTNPAQFVNAQYPSTSTAITPVGPSGMTGPISRFLRLSSGAIR